MSRKLRNALATGEVVAANADPVTRIEKAAKPKARTAKTKAEAKAEADADTETSESDLEKNDDEEEGEFFTIHKDVSGAIRAARIKAGASEQAAATALGVDLNTYVDFEENGGEMDITGNGIKALAKAFKMPVEDLAAQMLSTPAPVAPALTGAGSATSGDESEPPSDPLDKSAIKAEKRVAKSAQIRVLRVSEHEPNEDLRTMPLEKRKVIAYQRFAKSLFDPRAYARIEKGGIITADMFGPNANIDPVIANTLVNVFVDESALLKEVQTKIMGGKKQNVNVIDVPNQTATRLTSNVWPDNTVGTDPINGSLLLDAEKVHFTWIIDDDTLMTYMGNLPGLEAEVTGAFTRALSNDLLDLGLNATGGAYSGAFLNLNKGWLALARAGGDSGTGGINAATPAGQQISISTGNTGGTAFTTTEGILAAMLAAAYANGNARFFDDTTPFIFGPTDWQAHKQQMTSAHPTFPIPITGLDRQYEGHPVTLTNKLATGNYMLTALQNLVMGIVTGMPGAGGDGISIERFRVPNATRFIATVYVDYGIVNPKAMVVSKA